MVSPVPNPATCTEALCHGRGQLLEEKPSTSDHHAEKEGSRRGGVLTWLDPSGKIKADIVQIQKRFDLEGLEREFFQGRGVMERSTPVVKREEGFIHLFLDPTTAKVGHVAKGN